VTALEESIAPWQYRRTSCDLVGFLPTSTVGCRHGRSLRSARAGGCGSARGIRRSRPGCHQASSAVPTITTSSQHMERRAQRRFAAIDSLPGEPPKEVERSKTKARRSELPFPL